MVTAVVLPAQAQTWSTVSGTVTDSTSGTPLVGVTVVVKGTDFGTATDKDGQYSLRLPVGRYALRFSSVGFQTRADSVTVTEGTTAQLDVTMAAGIQEMEELTVTDEHVAPEAGVYEVDPEDVQNIPTPFKDGFRALKTVPGVATNNELSQQYSVRGGGYNENLIFINGFEVFMPFRARQGEQEGLGLLNPALASDITFYTGGFPPKYGGKLSSALDVQYAQPEDQPLTGSAAISTLDANVHAQSSALDGDLGWSVGARRAQPGRFFGTQDLKGDYEPRFQDVQTSLTYRFSDRVSVEALGIWADHTFELDPKERTTHFGVVSPQLVDFQALQANFTGAREDGYTTTVGGLRLHTDPTDRISVSHDLAYFRTRETESFDITSTGRVCQVNPSGDASADNCDKLVSTKRIRFADNAVEVQRLTGGGRYQWHLNRHALEAGWSLRSMHFDDRLDEKNVLVAEEKDRRVTVDSLRDRATFNEQQTGFYLQDSYDVLPTRDRLIVTGGLRGDYYTFNDEFTLSPRLSARFKYSDRLTLNGSWGIYHQQPTYRELRGTPDSIGQTNDVRSIEDALNRDLKSQRSMQFVLGGEYFLPDNRLYLRAEAYYKDLDNIIPYTIENIRVNYSGDNDTHGYTYGFDLQLRGEFVPGLESWFNYSFMISRERFTDEALSDFTGAEEWEGSGPSPRENRKGLLPRPADQRHTFSAFVQDYVPGSKSWKLHMRLLYGSGFPYTTTNPGPRATPSGGTSVRVPGQRMGGRLPAYRRVDVGATKIVELAEEGIAHPVKLELTLEVLNLFDMDNTVAYAWTGSGADITRIPQRLTPRTLNLRAHLTF
ncbi:MAG: TonB-dependent receptor [Bacteroidetes bacterium SW_9_63_38]|nr:MAG: TonB-dependent receptor [Bacteroidetes bacterium SW_9_63_38]